MNSFFPRTFNRDCPIVESARGVWLKDKQGNDYFDGSCGAIVTNIGHGVPEIEEAVIEQVKKVAYAHTSQFWSEPALKLSEKLISMAPSNFKNGRVYLTSGGSESVETALKMARAFYVQRGEHSRNIIISRRQSYHGATIGALSATGHPARRKPYLSLLKPPTLIPADYRYRCRCGYGPGSCSKEQCSISLADELEEAILLYGEENIAAFIAEPISGASLGAAVPGETYWPRIREICSKYGILMLVDEVMVGLGRTGTTFAIEHWNVIPDMIVLGKGLAAGYQPLGAVLASEEIVEAFKKNSGTFEHGYTYNGHPVASAAGLAVLEYLDKNNLVKRVQAAQSSFFNRLESFKYYPFVGDIRGKGFFAGIEFVKNKENKAPFEKELAFSGKVASEAARAGVLVYPGKGFLDGNRGDHILVAPPFVSTEEELDELFLRLKTAFDQVLTVIST